MKKLFPFLLLAIAMVAALLARGAAIHQNFATTNDATALSNMIFTMFAPGTNMVFTYDNLGRLVLNSAGGTNGGSTNPPPPSGGDFRYWGAAAKTVSNMVNSDVLALSSDTGTNRFMTQTITPPFGDYFYFAFPPYMGTPTFWVGPSQLVGWLTNSLTVTNGTSITNYILWQYPFQQGGSPFTIQVQ